MIPQFKLPAPVARIGAFLPQWPHAAALVLLLNLGRLLRAYPEDTLAAFEGKTFRVEVADAGTRALFRCSGGRFRPLMGDAAPDLVLRADLAAYLQLMLREEDADTLFFNRRLSIEGDTELGLWVKNMLDALEWPPAALRRKH